ncbi:helix-turn-helix transcriptional regulator [Arthrobacter roseus]|uniref:helix-turn-helix transcriptional regulator n=1 Tax=Arthrobacter roseus TaxID=136274 RepID=UPI001964C3F1|nr:helix-turn-helix domain-containing protein [Arthrobacter roseus]MBM7847722.1 DNA-binding XRE family transcriptional regulator [Arthrobacter roseus]
MEDAAVVGHAIRDARRNLGLTQTQLAELVGLSDRTIRDIEKAAGGPSFTSVVTAANAVGLRLVVS